MSAYYNEADGYPAQWLRNLCAAGHLPAGDVDERDIRTITDYEKLKGYQQGHFFAGIGVWAYALKEAGFPSDIRVWTGSCPCQPFSNAGKKLGTDDERHLWPDWFKLIRECSPECVFGEQVASDDGLSWLDLVYDSLESAGYTVRAVDMCAAGYGAPHIRQRLYFVAVAKSGGTTTTQQPRRLRGPERESSQGAMEHTAGVGFSQRTTGARNGERRRPPRATEQRHGDAGKLGEPTSEQRGEAGHEHSGRSAQRASDASQPHVMGDADRWRRGQAGRNARSNSKENGGREASWNSRTGPVNGFWSDAEWLACTDGKARAAKPGTFPLAVRTSGDVGRLRAYGNSIVAPQAIDFVRAAMEELNITPGSSTRGNGIGQSASGILGARVRPAIPLPALPGR